jgi:ribosomal protein L40E
VPVPKRHVLDDDWIMGILQPHESGISILTSGTPADGNDSSWQTGQVSTEVFLKVCRTCHRQIPADASSCPYCGTEMTPKSTALTGEPAPA